MTGNIKIVCNRTVLPNRTFKAKTKTCLLKETTFSSKAENLYTATCMLLHNPQIIRHFKCRIRLALYFVHIHARGNLSKSKGTSFSVNFEYAL